MTLIDKFELIKLLQATIQNPVFLEAQVLRVMNAKGTKKIYQKDQNQIDLEDWLKNNPVVISEHKED